MTIEVFVHKYGYLALAAGTLLEGETVVMAAGFAAYMGYLDLPLVWIITFCTTFAGIELYFLIARYAGNSILSRKPAWRDKLQVVNRYMTRYQNWTLPLFRFFYVLRNLFPLAFGISNITLRRFTVWNALGALVWSVLFGTLGYVFGGAFRLIFKDITHYEAPVIGGILAVGVAFWLFRHFRGRSNRPREM
jgi:membrane protein DedA with SNARE-associated domain